MKKKKAVRYYHGTTGWAAQRIKETGLFEQGTLTRDMALAKRWVLKVMKPSRNMGGAALVEIVLEKPPLRRGKIPHAFDVGRKTFAEALLGELRVSPSKIRIAKKQGRHWIWQ